MEAIAPILFRLSLLVPLSSTCKLYRSFWRQSDAANTLFNKIKVDYLQCYQGAFMQNSVGHICNKLQNGVNMGFLHGDQLEHALMVEFRGEKIMRLTTDNNNLLVKTSAAVDHCLIRRQSVEQVLGRDVLMSEGLDYFLTEPRINMGERRTTLNKFFALLDCHMPPPGQHAIAWSQSLIAMAELGFSEAAFSRSSHWLYTTLSPLEWPCTKDWFRLIALNFGYIETAKSFPAHAQAAFDPRAVGIVKRDNRLRTVDQFVLLIQWYAELLYSDTGVNMNALNTREYRDALDDPRCQAALKRYSGTTNPVLQDIILMHT